MLLDVDAGPSTNRTVYTFVGNPQDVVSGALNAARMAFQLIDMSKHKGKWNGIRGNSRDSESCHVSCGVLLE